MRETAANRGWDVALDAANDLVAMLRSPTGERYLTHFAEAMIGKEQAYQVDISGERLNHIDQAAADEYVARMVASTVMSVEEGDPIWIAEDVVELVQVGSETFKPQPVMPDDLLIPNAFAYLAKPLLILDRHERRVKIRAVSWHRIVYGDNPGNAGVMYALWSRLTDHDDYSDHDHRSRIVGSELVLAHVGHAPFGTTRWLKDLGGRMLMVQLQVMWRLMKQQIIVGGLQPVSRPVWRRKSNRRQIKHVTVLTLRRVKVQRDDGEERDVEWSHRWLVRGHWRNQPYRVNGETVYHEIWIDGYVKGPEHLPLVVKKRAVEFIR